MCANKEHSFEFGKSDNVYPQGSSPTAGHLLGSVSQSVLETNTPVKSEHSVEFATVVQFVKKLTKGSFGGPLSKSSLNSIVQQIPEVKQQQTPFNKLIW